MKHQWAACVIACAALSPASAHVTVEPAEAAAGIVQRYCVRVPSEKKIPTTRVELQFPDGLEVTAVEEVPGWRGSVQKGRQGRIVGATWDGGSIPPKQSAVFPVLARNPSTRTELTWRAIQTYQDGSEVHWIGAPKAQFPAALTRVVTGAQARVNECSGGRPSSSHSLP
jgi:uncharacterized protein YcnI